jgi:amino acid transporter
VAVSIAALLITIPAYWGNKVGVPWAYFAITAICTVGLYLAYIIPVYLRLRRGDAFVPGPWNLGRHYRWINIGAIVFVLLVVYSLDIPTVPAGVPWKDGFDWTAVNYSPLVLVVGLLVGIWWIVSARKRYTGPVRTIDELEDTPEAPGAAPTTAR